jgi:hypothetical protein
MTRIATYTLNGCNWWIYNDLSQRKTVWTRNVSSPTILRRFPVFWKRAGSRKKERKEEEEAEADHDAYVFC